MRMEANEVRLLAEQLSHTIDLLRGRMDTLEAGLRHQVELDELRLGALERTQADQEARLRAAADAAVRLTTTTSLAQAAQAAFAVILAALAAYLGRQ
jgi:hypothetical protein